jgi:hypothetical protein
MRACRGLPRTGLRQGLARCTLKSVPSAKAAPSRNSTSSTIQLSHDADSAEDAPFHAGGLRSGTARRLPGDGRQSSKLVIKLRTLRVHQRTADHGHGRAPADEAENKAPSARPSSARSAKGLSSHAAWAASTIADSVFRTGLRAAISTPGARPIPRDRLSVRDGRDGLAG